MFKFLKKTAKASSQPLVVNVVDEAYVLSFMQDWNFKFPIDRWWRERHSVAFNSAEHRAVSFFDMRFEFEEELMFRRRNRFQTYKLNSGDFMDVASHEEMEKAMSDEERMRMYKDEFENLDLSQYDD